MFLVNECAVREFEVQWDTDVVDCIIEETKRSLDFNN